MAAQSAHHVQRCGACAQSFRMRPQRIAVHAHVSGAEHAECCPFCGFLNRPNAAMGVARASLKVVRPPEPLVRPEPVAAATAVSGGPQIRQAVGSSWRKTSQQPKKTEPHPVFGSIFDPVHV